MPSTVVRQFRTKGKQRIERLPVASGQTIKQGDFVCFDSSGNLIQAVAASATLSTATLAAWTTSNLLLVVGQAQEDFPAPASDPTMLTKYKIAVMIAEPGTQFLMPIAHATPSSAYPNQNLLGRGVNLANWTFPAAVGANTMYAVDITAANLDNAKAKAQIVDFDDTDWPAWGSDMTTITAPSSGTQSQYAGAWVEFLGNASALTGGRSLTRSN